ncbi:MAG TPA: TRAM domain-containing protein [Longimicrobiales bacterium]
MGRLSLARRAGGARGAEQARGVEVDITGIAAGGAGVGRLPDGRAVFVHRTAPEDRAAVRLVEEKQRWARGALLRVLRPGPGRRAAPCPHYARCGGCTLQHLTYAAQLRVKRDIVADALRRIGGVEIEVPDVAASPEELGYRNRVSFTLRRLGGGRVVAGFHEVGRPDRIVDIPACLLAESAVVEVWGRLRAAWGEDARRLPSGRELRLTLRGTSAGDVALLVEGGTTVGWPEELLERVPGLAAVWHLPAGAEEPVLLAGRAMVREVWSDEALELGGAMFLQVNRGAAARLEAYVLDRAGDVAGRRVVDAYCGIGVYARRLARAGARVVGIERDARAVDAARAAAPEGAEFVAGAVEERLGDALPAELVILNPPRVGLDPAVPALLRRVPPRRLIYVSCDPATLARDLARLAPVFRARSVRCFDLFPQTAHVETVVELACDTT